MIIPGFIGGRMVKFLEEITVTEQESDNFYHFHDNRVMPPHVDEELAKKEGESVTHTHTSGSGSCMAAVACMTVL
jgi:acyl dehydratase